MQSQARPAGTGNTVTTANSSEPESETERTFVISRVMEAPARLLYEAYSKPEHISKWFGPPGYPLTMCKMDFRVGGKFRFAMTGPDGKQHTPFGGTYLELVHNKRIKYDNGFEASPPEMKLKTALERMVVTVTFDEQQDGKTKLTVTTVFGSVAMMKEHLDMGYEQGTGAGLAQLADVAKDLAERAFAVSRVIDAPARLVFLAYSKAEHLKQWYGPPTWPVTTCEVDFRVGGKYHMRMTGPDGKQGPPFGGTYLEIVPNEKIVYDDVWEPDASGVQRLVITVAFVESPPGRTTIEVLTVFDSAASKKKHVDMGMEQGLKAAWSQLDGVVAKIRESER